MINYYGKTKLSDSASTFLASTCINSIVPSKMGDLIKAYYFKRYGAVKVLGLIFSERIFDLFVLILLAFISSMIIQLKGFMIISIGLFLGIVCLFAIIIYNPFRQKFVIIEKFSNSFSWIVKNKLLSMKMILITILSWAFSLIQIFFLYMALEGYIEPVFFVAAIILVIFVGMIPVTIAGMGTRDSAILLLFSGIAPQETLLAFGLLFVFTRYWLVSIVSLPFLYIVNKK